jgi:DNA-binding MarR family transcriptional regulator
MQSSHGLTGELMNSFEPILHPPHFPIAGAGPGSEAAPSVAIEAGELYSSADPREVGTLALRTAECLVAALVECTAEAGLNEARYRVLAALHRRAGGESSQSGLASLLLQSESNLSTLLERMSADGLISRTRSQTDRRRSLIRMAAPGFDALERAERARGAALARLMRELSAREIGQLAVGLGRFVDELERALDVADRGGVSSAANGPAPPHATAADLRGSAVAVTADRRPRSVEAHSS